jgi:Ni/Fe-hydrogenase subunit HybB-like protein
MHLKLRFRHADSFGIRKAQKPNGHSIPCGQLIPKKAACVFETARYEPFLKIQSLFSRAYYTGASSKTIMRI